MASTNTMIQQCHALVGTRDVDAATSKFLENAWERSQEGKRPDLLTPPQVEWLEDIHAKHFGN